MKLMVKQNDSGDEVEFDVKKDLTLHKNYVFHAFPQVEKRLLDEKEESPAKKLKMETKATEEDSDNGKALISLDEKVKVKKAQNVQEKLAEMKNAYLEDLEDEMAEDVEEDEVDEDDVLIESETLSEEAKMMNEDEGGYGKINEKQASSTETECQVCFIPDGVFFLNL